MGALLMDLASLPQWVAIGFLSILGLLIGSFLNVVVHRLPIMMEQEWAELSAEASDPKEPPPTDESKPRLTLSAPRSRCPHCGHAITWFENIPVLSWLALRGKCSSCKAPICLRYPTVEIATALCFGAIASHLGATPAALAWCGFCATLIALALIDWDTTLLPDSLTIPLCWAGLLATLLGWTRVTLDASLLGAVFGYLSLWLIVKVFWLVTGKVGMGEGDFKLFAALGAWFGWPALIPIVVCASVAGAVIGIAIKLRGNLREGGVFPFGPFLVAGAAIHAMWPTLILGALR
jgi:leader peptidase (prepilin peptidase) / N-methyltransferase